MGGIEILSDTDIWLRLAQGVGVTLSIALLSIALALPGGMLLGVAMSSKNKIVYLLCRGALEMVRIMPPIVWLFLMYFGMARLLDIHLSAMAAAVWVFALWGMFELMDLVRGALASIGRGPLESALSLGLSRMQCYRLVMIPLAMRRLLPAAVNLFSRMIKTTSIVPLIGVVELVKVGQQIIESRVFTHPTAAFWIYGLIFFIYFAMCYPISHYSEKLEQRYRQAS